MKVMIALCVGLLLAVYALDRAAGAAPVQHLYYVPIVLAATRFRMRGGLLAAASAIALYHFANPHLLTLRYGEQDVVQVLLFIAVGVVTAQLTHDRERLRQLSLTDDLTGLHNLRSFEACLSEMIRTSRETSVPLALLVLDVDRLKTLNDRHGHLAGADAVRTVGSILRERLAREAVACRYGGDEFAIVIPAGGLHRTRRLAEDLRASVHACAPLLDGHQFEAGTLSISIGGTCAELHRAPQSWAPPGAEIGEALFRSADSALYRAKASGRNRAWIGEWNLSISSAKLAQR
jgi:diguanylate cyclase (GGDEF)-like protein